MYGTNVVSFQLESGRRRWFIVRCNIAPSNEATIKGIISAIGQRPCGAALLVAVNFSSDLAASEGNRWEEYISAAVATAGM